MSKQTSFYDALTHLDRLCQQAIAESETIIINRPDGQNVVLLAELELNSLMETLYLLRSPKNATRLFDALDRAKAETISPKTVEDVCSEYELDEILEEDNLDIQTA